MKFEESRLMATSAQTAVSHSMLEVLREYVRIYQIRNRSRGALEPQLQKEWIKLSFAIDSIFSGMYWSPFEEPGQNLSRDVELQTKLPLDSLRVPVEADVICETEHSLFAAKLRDISTRGAYVHAPVPFEKGSRLRLIFSTFDRPLDLEGKVAWNNPGSMRKRNLSEGAGVEFIDCDDETRRRLRDYVCELLQQKLARANSA